MATSAQSRLGSAPEEAIKAPVVVATASNITLSGLQELPSIAGQTVQLVAGDRVLVASQTDATENGIYVAASADWSRATDWNANDDVVNGVLVATSSQQLIYVGTFTGTFNIGSTAVTFAQFGADLIASLTTIYEDLQAINQAVTISTDAPSGGSDGDIWYKVSI